MGLNIQLFTNDEVTEPFLSFKKKKILKFKIFLKSPLANILYNCTLRPHIPFQDNPQHVQLNLSVSNNPLDL